MAALPGALRPGELLIDDDFHDYDSIFKPVVNGEPKGRGHDPDQVDKVLKGTFKAVPSVIKQVPKSDWSARLKEMVAQQMLISDVRKTMANGGMLPCLDQGQVGYCWAHSTTHCVMLDRGMRNMPWVPLSAYSVAATIKRGADEGGWCGQSCKFAREKGIVSQAIWPQGDRNYRQYDKPETWQDALKHKIEEDIYDLTKAEYDQDMSFEQICSLLMSGIPCVGDFNWWGHSVCLLDVVEVEPGDFGIRILNSWGMGWGDAGTSVLRGSKCRPDNAIAVLASKAA